MATELPLPEIRNEQFQLFLHSSGVSVLTDQEKDQISQTYSSRLTEALEHGSTPFLKMTDTLIPPVWKSNRQTSERVLVCEVGGSNFYSSLVQVDREGNATIATEEDGTSAVTEFPLRTREYKSAAAFIEELLDAISPLLKKAHNIHTFSLIFSFPAEPVPVSTGVDVLSREALMKGFVLPGISKQPVGQLFLHSLNKRGINILRSVVLNDTPSVLLSETNSRIGVVVGTGANLAATIQGRLYNTATGGSFTEIPAYPLFSRVDMHSGSEKEYYASKQAGGMYIEAVFSEAVRELSRIGVIPTADSDITDLKMINLLLKKQYREFQKQYPMFNDLSCYFLAEIAHRLTERSAQLMGTFIGTIFKTFPESFRKRELIPAEGSVFWNVPNYEKDVLAAIDKSDDSQREVKFVKHDHAGILGAARAALLMSRDVP